MLKQSNKKKTRIPRRVCWSAQVKYVPRHTEKSSRISMPCWIRNTSEIPVEVAKDRDLPTKVGWRWKVEEEEDKDDEGPVELTGAYKTSQLDIKHLKERLRYISQKLQIRNIAISEEDRLATEHRQGSLLEDVLDKQEEAVVLDDHEEESQKGAQVSSDTECELAKREATEHADT